MSLFHFHPQQQTIKLYDYETVSRATAESDDDIYDNFEFDVKPKRRYFETPQEKRRYVEEYTKKRKTELCKNWELVGECRFGDECSFAHGMDQLQPKKHLHEKYKTKPCKRFHKQGACCYGNRCQYKHDELRDSRRSDDAKYLKDVYSRSGVPLPISGIYLDKHERYDLQRFWKLVQNHQLQKPSICLVLASRLKCFEKITEDTSFLSRKGSQASLQ